ncbi:hypothetical protein V3481_000977 [Fusarium oxysporum f. sp. vasinfectum]
MSYPAAVRLNINRGMLQAPSRSAPFRIGSEIKSDGCVPRRVLNRLLSKLQTCNHPQKICPPPKACLKQDSRRFTWMVTFLTKDILNCPGLLSPRSGHVGSSYHQPMYITL